MNAILNIYKDCSSEEPSKQYVCRRLLTGVSKKVQALGQGMENKSVEEQDQITLDILKTIFPNFDDDDYNYIDPVEWLAFIDEINQENIKLWSNAQKN